MTTATTISSQGPRLPAALRYPLIFAQLPPKADDPLSTCRLLTPEVESRRGELLEKIRVSGDKINILSTALSQPEMSELIDLTRSKYITMPCIKAAIKRLNLAFDESFSPDDSKNFKKLADRVIGYYLNTNQYHNAFHAISMTLEAINLFNILGVKDINVLKAIVAADLYHDTGNGEAPVAPDNQLGDEVQSTKIFIQDLKEVERRIKAGEPLGDLAALAEFSKINIRYPIPVGSGQTCESGVCSLAEAVTACIAYTVFKDRFAEAEKLPFACKYISIILKEFYGNDSLNFEQVEKFSKLSKSFFVWLVKNADVAGSLEGIHSIQNSILSYAEDQRRTGYKPGSGENFDQYREGFLGMLKGAYASAETPMVRVAKDGTLCPFPTLSEEQHCSYYSPEGLKRLEKFIKERIEEESYYFERAKYGFGKILTAIFAVAAEESKANRNIANLTLEQLTSRLEEWQGADIAKLRLALPHSKLDNFGAEIEKLDFDLKDFPLLRLKENSTLTIADLSPAMFNQIFMPGISEVRTPKEAEIIIAIEDAARIFKRTNPPNFQTLEKFLGKFSPEQKILILESQRIEFSKSSELNAEQKVMAEVWAKLRQSFNYHQLLQLAETGIIDRRIMSSSEEASCIKETLQKIIRDNDDKLLRPCLTGILNLASHCPRSLRLLTYNPNDEVISKGQEAGWVYIVLEGQLTVKLDNKDIVLKPGDIAGEMSVLTGNPAIASVYCAKGQSAQVAAVRQEDVFSQYSDDFEIRANLIRLARSRRGLEDI